MAAKKQKNKSAKKSGGESEELFFVQVIDPVQIRSDIIGCMKQILTVLESKERYHTLRKDKEQLHHQIKKELATINKLITGLKAKLPNITVHVPKQKKAKSKSKASKKSAKSQKPLAQTPSKPLIGTSSHHEQPHVDIPPREMSELEKLEAELGEIENKLKGLS